MNGEQDIIMKLSVQIYKEYGNLMGISINRFFQMIKDEKAIF